MATQTVTQTDNGIQGITLTSALGNADTSTTFAFPPCQQAYMWLQGTLGSATVTLQVSYDGGTTWEAFSTGTTLSALPTNPVSFIPPGGALCRVISAGGSGAALNWYIGYSKAFI